MNRIVLAVAAMAMVAWARPGWSADVAPLNAGFDAVYPALLCAPLPPWYPAGWEIVIHTPCPPGFYAPYGRPPAWRGRVARADGAVHRRPYLRPGWWW
jgi:hypothetical protein